MNETPPVNRVTCDHVMALPRAVGPDPVIVERPDGVISVEPDRAMALAAGAPVIARQHAASGVGVANFPESMAAMLSGLLDGRTRYLGDSNPFD